MPNPILTNPKTSHAGDAADLLTKYRELTRRTIADTDQLIGPLSDYRAELRAKPKPQLATALMEAIRARHPELVLTAEELEIANRALRCSGCNSIFVVPCNCGVPHVRAGARFFADRPELLKQINGKGANGHDVTKNAPDVTKVTSETKDELSPQPMTPAERQRRSRAKLAAERRNGGSMIDELFPKDSPACDFDWEHGQDQGESESFQRARAAKWQLLEAERLAMEFALLRDGATSAEIKSTVHIKAARKVAHLWAKLADELKTRRRP